MRGITLLVWTAIVCVPVWGQHKLEPSDFKTASECKACHSEIYAQWKTSTHSEAFRDPIYQAVLKAVSEKTEGRSERFCVSCHSPLASVTNTIPDRPFAVKDPSPLLADGVTCMFCHTISGQEVKVSRVSLGAFLFPRIGQTKVLYGRHPDAKTPHHETEVSSFLLSSELCGTCHRFAHPASGNVIQDTYAEWKNSPYAAEGKRCQDCHMPAYSGKVAASGKQRPELHAHVFMGGHTEMIKKAATIKLNGTWKADNLEVTAEVINSGAGHLIPTGIPGIRQMWLEVSVFDGGQAVKTETRPFGLELFDGKKQPAMPWDAVSIGKDTRIAPKQSRLEKIDFRLARTSGIRVEARLLERLVSEQAARYAGIPASPPLVMAQASTSVP
ncbi:MAG: multiheme c-type cytochrome [Acidobacteriota bacterium]